MAKARLTMDVEYRDVEMQPGAMFAVDDLLVSVHCPELHRAVRDTPGALAEARRIIDACTPEPQLAAQRELAEIEKAEAELARRKAVLMASSR